MLVECTSVYFYEPLLEIAVNVCNKLIVKKMYLASKALCCVFSIMVVQKYYQIASV